MSLAAKLTLLTSITATSGIIYAVVYRQNTDRANLHIGVVKDMERQEMKKQQQEEREMKKQQNLKLFQEQVEFTRLLEQQQKEEEMASSQESSE